MKKLFFERYHSQFVRRKSVAGLSPDEAKIDRFSMETAVPIRPTRDKAKHSSAVKNRRTEILIHSENSVKDRNEIW
jgi:hypothetical protein